MPDRRAQDDVGTLLRCLNFMPVATAGVLDSVKWKMNRYYDAGQHLHRSSGAGGRRVRAWALLWDFRPWPLATARAYVGLQSPNERVNGHRHDDNWPHNLSLSASPGGAHHRKARAGDRDGQEKAE